MPVSSNWRRLLTPLNTAGYVSKANFDKEFEIYQDLWQKMLMAAGMIAALPCFHSPKEFTPIENDEQGQALLKVVGDFGMTCLALNGTGIIV